jgi:hypothetical protein
LLFSFIQKKEFHQERLLRTSAPFVTTRCTRWSLILLPLRRPSFWIVVTAFMSGVFVAGALLERSTPARFARRRLIFTSS